HARRQPCRTRSFGVFRGGLWRPVEQTLKPENAPRGQLREGPECRVVQLARLAGVEPAARGFEGRCSIQLSYRRVVLLLPPLHGRVKLCPRRSGRGQAGEGAWPAPARGPQKNKGIRCSGG